MSLPFALAAPDRPVLGLVALSSDETVERDLRALIPAAEADLLVTRVPSGAEVTRATLGAMEAALPAAAALLPPAAPLAGIGYGCTSGASVIGSEAVASMIHRARPGVPVTDPLAALIAACRRRGIARLALLSPYVEEVSLGLRGALERAGIATPLFGSFDEAEEARVARIDRASIVEGAAEVVRPGGVDAIFLSCTNLRALGALPEIEARPGRPALCSNGVMAEEMRRLAGLGAPAP